MSNDSIMNSIKNSLQSDHWSKDYVFLLSEEGNAKLDDVLNVSMLLEDLLYSKGDQKSETAVPADQMSSLFRVMKNELSAIKAEMPAPGGIFSQGEVLLGVKAVRHFGIGQIEEMISNSSSHEH